MSVEDKQGSQLQAAFAQACASHSRVWLVSCVLVIWCPALACLVHVLEHACAARPGVNNLSCNTDSLTLPLRPFLASSCSSLILPACCTSTGIYSSCGSCIASAALVAAILAMLACC